MNDTETHQTGGPLSPGELRQADRALRRVHEQLGTFLRGLPGQARSASGLARFLNVDRTTCQRLVFIASRPYAGISAIEKMPGVRGLRCLLEAASAGPREVDQETLEQLDASIGLLEDCFSQLGGSQSALIRRVAATGRPDGESGVDQGEEQARRQLFQAAAGLTGRCSDTWVAVYAWFPSTESPNETVEVARVHGLVGHEAREDALPLTFHNFASGQVRDEAGSGNHFKSLLGESEEDAPAATLPQFSTSPLPVVSSRQPGEYLVQAIDTRGDRTSRPVDVMFGTRNRSSHPHHRSPPLEEAWAMINFPVRKMVFDVYLHRDLARTCIPALDVHLWRPDFAAHPGDRWQTRFATGPRLELLGTGLDNSRTPAYERHGELSAFLFEQVGEDAGDFIGFRCALDYPIWRTGYCMSFDFSSH